MHYYSITAILMVESAVVRNSVIISLSAPVSRRPPPIHSKQSQIASATQKRPCTLLPLLLLLFLTSFCEGKVNMHRNGCGDTKVCLFKPAGCDPQLDCTLGIIFYVSGPNKLTVQLVAQSLQPHPQLQYIAIGFSKDARMGNDFVSECVLSPGGSFFVDVDVYASFNNGNSNDRTYLEDAEHGTLYDQIEGEVVDGRLQCQFVQQLVPQMNLKDGAIWNLNRKYFVLGATGSAKHDEINAHDLSIGSHFYPLVSSSSLNPSLIGERLYDLPRPYEQPRQPAINNTVINTNVKARAAFGNAAAVPALLNSPTLIFLIALLPLITIRYNY